MTTCHQLMTAKQVAERWQTSPRDILRKAQRGELKAIYLSERVIRFDPKYIEALEKARTR